MIYPLVSQTVLVIDDNEANTRLLAHVFQLRPHVKLISASLGEEGLAVAAEKLPDLILLDLHLPDMHGTQVMSALKSNPNLKQTPVVILSADAILTQSTFPTSSEAFRCITKPFDLDDLLEVVDSALSREP